MPGLFNPLAGLLPLLLSSLLSLSSTLSPDFAAPTVFRQAAAQADSALQVELDVFSGRPNPSWELTSEEATPLLNDLSAWQERAQGETPTVLGYRGLIVQGPELHNHGWDRLEVGGGTIVAHTGATTFRFSDDGRAFECRLLATGQGRLNADDFAIFELLAFPQGVAATCGEARS